MSITAVDYELALADIEVALTMTPEEAEEETLLYIDEKPPQRPLSNNVKKLTYQEIVDSHQKAVLYVISGADKMTMTARIAMLATLRHKLNTMGKDKYYYRRLTPERFLEIAIAGFGKRAANYLQDVKAQNKIGDETANNSISKNPATMAVIKAKVEEDEAI